MMEPAQTFTAKYIPQAFGSKKKLILGFLAFVFLLFVFQWVNSPMIVTVTGSGEVSAPAESATISFTINANSDNTQSAISSVKSRVTRIKDSLKASGIPDSDIYESQIATYPASAITAGAGGYTAISTMGLKTTKINDLDSIISDLYGQGASLVSQPVLTVENTDSLEKEAFNMAVTSAKKKAGSIALRNLKFIKKIVLIEQNSTSPSSTITTKADIDTQTQRNIAPDEGVIRITKSVSVSYKMW